MRSLPVEVEPAVLKWARKTAHLSVEEAARRIGVSAVDVLAWEEGAVDRSFAKLTYARLLDVARAYGRPLPLFFLDSPPTDFKVPKDFRRVPESEREAWSPELAFELRRIAAQRQAAIELMEIAGENAEPIEFVAHRTEDSESLSERIREWLGVSDSNRARQAQDAFGFWSDRIETKGVLVAQLWGIPVTEVRGCSISEQPFPIVAVNIRDSRGGRAFTLLHELTHILLHDGGVCDLDERVSTDDPELRKTEDFCNRVAAALLMPRRLVLQDPAIASAAATGFWSDAALASISRRYGVSEEVALLRLVTLGRADRDEYWARRPAFANAYAALRERRNAEKEGEGGMPPAQRRLSEMGRRFVTEALGAYERRDITGSDLSEYLDLKLDHLPSLRQLVSERR